MNYQISHVLMTAEAGDGVWAYSVNLAHGLAQLGIRTTLVTMGPEPSARQRGQAESIPELSLITSVFRLESMEDPWADVDASGAWLLALADRVKPDIVHLNGFSHAALPWRAPVVVVHHGDRVSSSEAVKGEPAPRHLDEYRRRVGEGLCAASLVVASTRAMLEDIDRIYGPLENKNVVPPGIESGEYLVGIKKHMVFSVGRCGDEAENLHLLEKVAPVVDWPMYVAGDLDGESRRTANLVALGRLDRSALTAWYSRASIFALPAKYEPSGLSILEAASCGCALVLGDVASLRELWGDAAIYLNPDDPGLWSDALNMLSKDDDLRHELGIVAREKAMTYSARTMACSMLFAYQDLRQASALDSHVLRGATLI